MLFREINQKGLELLKRFEGCRLKAYKCPAGVWTIGYGSTEKKHPEIVDGLVIDLSKAEGYLKQDLQDFYHLDHYLNDQVTDNQFSALVCLAYNIGLGALKTSSVIILINSGNKPDKAWMAWNHIKGQVSAGLTNRRKAELELYHTLEG